MTCAAPGARPATRAGLPGLIPHDFGRTAVRNTERAGVRRSAAMRLVGHRTEAIYGGSTILDEAMLREGAEKLAALDAAVARTGREVVPIRYAQR